MRIVVAGGTGLVGSLVVQQARSAGHDTTVLARSTGADLVTGAGVDAALAGADTVIDTTNVDEVSADKAAARFGALARQLVAAAARAGVQHIVLLSIVGIDRNPHGYYAGKLAQEEVYEASPLPWTILRATQFHEFAQQMFEQAKAGPAHIAPRGRTQPVAAREVAAQLLAVAVGPAQRHARDLAGPREEQLSDMVKAYAKAIGYRAPVPAVDLPGAQMRGMRAGLNLPGPGALLGVQTFDGWLSEVRTAHTAP